MPTRININQWIAEGKFPSSSQRRRWEVGIYGNASYTDKPANPSDGFGWVTLHIGPSGYVGSGGAWRSKGASWAAKKSQPFASNIVIWNYEQMMKTIKSFWHRYSEEEREDIDKAMAGYGVRTGSTAEARRSSPFAQWSDRANQLASVDAPASGGGSVHGGWLTAQQEAHQAQPT